MTINTNNSIYVAYKCSREKSGLFNENKIALIIKELNINALNKLNNILSILLILLNWYRLNIKTTKIQTALKITTKNL